MREFLRQNLTDKQNSFPSGHLREVVAYEK